jgi:hypothetical protein
MRQAVVNLSDRVENIETKITKIDKILKNHRAGIRKKVVEEKYAWIN